jgi:hypothetical protein
MKKFVVFVMLCVCGSLAFSQEIFAPSEAIQKLVDSLIEELPAGSYATIQKFDAPTAAARQSLLGQFESLFLEQKKINVVDMDFFETRKELLALQRESGISTEKEVASDQFQFAGYYLNIALIFVRDNVYELTLRALESENAVLRYNQQRLVKPDRNLTALLRTAKDADTSKFAVGVRGGWTTGMNNVGSGTMFNELDLKSAMEISQWNGPTLALYIAYNLNSLFSVQLEGDFVLSNGVGLTLTFADHKEEVTVQAATIDIPLLARMNLLSRKLLVLRLFAGPYVSLAGGDIAVDWSTDAGGSTSKTVDAKSVGNRFGLVAGLSAGFNLGTGRILADFRLLNDLGATKAEKMEELGKKGSSLPASGTVFYRRLLNFSVGYEKSF